MIGGSASAVLRPTLFTNQRYERDSAKILLFELRLTLAGKLDEVLITLFLADWNDQTTSDGQLLFQRLGDLRPTGRDQDCIKRRSLGPTPRAVADAQFDVLVTE